MFWQVEPTTEEQVLAARDALRTLGAVRVDIEMQGPPDGHGDTITIILPLTPVLLAAVGLLTPVIDDGGA